MHFYCINKHIAHITNRDLRPSCSSGTEPSWLQFTIPCPHPEDREEEVYDDLCYVTFSTCLPEVRVTQSFAYLSCKWMHFTNFFMPMHLL